MADRRPLRDYRRSRAVLIGISDYVQLPPVPAAGNSLERMTGLLTGELCGWPSDRISVFRNESGPGELADRIITLFDEARDVALFYFVGHGQIDLDDQLCLGLAGSRAEPHRRAATSLQFHSVRRAMLDSPAATKILILDCCFAGLASRPSNTLGTPDYLLDKAAGTGAYTMAASSAYSTAWFETGRTKPQTYFTKYLADLVEAGIPGQPAGLRIRPLFTCLRENLARDHRPQPVDRSVDTASDFVFAHNAAPPETQVDHELELQRLRKRLAELETAAASGTGEPEGLHDQARYRGLLPPARQEQLGIAMQQAGRKLDETNSAYAKAENRYREAAIAASKQPHNAGSSSIPAEPGIATPRTTKPRHVDLPAWWASRKPKGRRRPADELPAARSTAESKVLPSAASPAHCAGARSDSRLARRQPGQETAQGPSRPSKDPRRGTVAVLAATIVIAVTLSAAGLSGYRYIQAKWHPANFTGQGHGTVLVTVSPKDTVRSLAPQLLHKGVIDSISAFITAAKTRNDPHGIVPGTFQLHKDMNAALAYQLLLNPQSRYQATVTIRAGLQEQDIIRTLCTQTWFKSLLCAVSPVDAATLGLPSFANGNPEGYLFPGTYTIQPDETWLQVLQAMTARFRQEAQSINLPAAAKAAMLSQHKVIIVASLIQAEAGQVSDFPKIARVIYNRLNTGMKLQLDSTAYYIPPGQTATEIIQRIGRDERKTNSPYNTYLHAGLPPTPIDSPGDAAIKAALHPAHGDWLYFVTVDPKKHITKFTASETQFEQFKAELARNIKHGA